MTAGEMKFALQVEMILNRIPQPEYRQLMVEAMMVLILIEQHDNGKTRWNEVICVDRLVHTANDIFLDEQVCSSETTNKMLATIKNSTVKAGGRSKEVCYKHQF